MCDYFNWKFLEQLLIDKHNITVLRDMVGPNDVNVIDGCRVPIESRWRILPAYNNETMLDYTEKVADLIKEKHPYARYYAFYELRELKDGTLKLRCAIL